MNQIEEDIKLNIKSRATEAILLQIPVDAMRSLEEVAASRDMSIDALLKFYIGNGLREDKAKLFSDRQKHINYSKYRSNPPQKELTKRVEAEPTMMKPIKSIFISNRINSHSNCVVKSRNCASFSRANNLF